MSTEPTVAVRVPAAVRKLTELCSNRIVYAL